ncbi:DNA primase [Corynebacterium sanguinis]|uniref:DNA primase n=1 Tax=Corynebacterium TaxID=1716 RepID=UPI0011A85C69|nr:MULTISPECIES: DNA primase [Corynebacterium]MCT1556074.1 DNA primase [Corynebacterium sanguinis]MCT1584022.1 DNA primase [Corynebacterium sanguinis]MCT1663171.1 DNA primase [Corynebacterium sanguinis]MCT2023771.1 DNA primase [Corynebacterium sanguinis]MCT2046482.1 DNA primase [Corynebacterium sanguinis]
MAKGRIPDSDIQAIRERAPIDEIVGEYVQLKPAGHDSLKGLSPFKDEKTPSFHVRPARGYYHCFSTGKGGDVFSFLMEMEQLTFPEAVEAVAEQIGYHINYQGGSTGARDVKPGTRARLLAANKAAHEFYREQLESPEAKPGRDFLLNRGFDKDTIYHFECGYAPDGWDTLTKHLLRKGFDVQELQDAGLSTMGRRGPIDKFRRRLLWPIKDVAGNVIGFGARKLFDDDPMGKYMNTSDTMLYHKSKVLFGLDLAKKSIATEHQTVVVEGYTDVMAMHAAGVKTAVAACGTAFGKDHMSIIRRLMLDDNYFRGELIYTFDGDEAGQKAAMRAFEGDQSFTGQSFVAVAPEGMDPCDLRLDKGDSAVRDLVASRVPMYEFVLQTLLAAYSLETAEGRLQALRRTVPVVADISDPVLQTEYARRLAGWVGWPNPGEVIAQVRDEAKKPKKAKRSFSPRAQSNQPTNTGAPLLVAPAPNDSFLWPQREALKIALQYPDAAGDYFDGINPDAFTNDAYRQVRDAMDAVGSVAAVSSGVEWISDVAGQMRDLAGRNFVSELAVEEIHADDIEAYADSVLSRLQEARVGDQIAQLKAQLERMRPADDERAYNALFSDLLALETARRELNIRAFRPGH